MEAFIPSMIIGFGLAALIASYIDARTLLLNYTYLLLILAVIGTLVFQCWVVFIALIAVPAFISSLFGLCFGALIRRARLENKRQHTLLAN